jgi:hypothetical protein
MALMKRFLEDIIEEEFYPCDLDYEYQEWVKNKELQNHEDYINNYKEMVAAYEEMLADRY